MKRLFILASAAIVALAACTKTEVVYNEAPQEISFRAVTGSMTKTTDFSERTNNTLGVVAEHGDDRYFENTEFRKNGNTWTAGRYWPIQGKLDFTVYAPYVDDADFDTDANVLTIPVADNSGAQIDWLYGQKRYIGMESGSNIETQLYHGLSKINVNIKATEANVYTVNSILLHGTHQAGTLSVVYNVDGTFSEITPEAADPAVTADLEFANTAAEKITTADTNVPQKSLYVFPSDYQTSFTIKYTLAGSNVELTGNVPISGEWVSGKEYIYNLTFTANAIVFAEPEINPWGEGGEDSPVVE